MKIQLEFEESDLREMITAYFQTRGFDVKNIGILIEQFKSAYPDGVKVEAEPLLSTPVAERTTLRAPAPFVQPEDLTEKKESRGTRRMSITDLMDPTPSVKVPTRDELLRAEQAELARILEQSRALKEGKDV